MPIAARWRSLARLPAPRGRDALPGVYELADADRRVIYIGQSATDVPNRLRQHLAAGGCVAEAAAFWRMAASRVPQADEARLLAAYEAVHGRLPACNRARPLQRGARRRYSERSSGR
ncbi:MAG: GIY-YIG nuclease family protein [Trueperaceae bacterium]|nr:GIY-YIG nuclease family protein [Trueperaceae bacterium]